MLLSRLGRRGSNGSSRWARSLHRGGNRNHHPGSTDRRPHFARRPVAIVVAVFGALGMLIGPTYAAEAERDVVTSRAPIDAEFCRWMIDGLKAAERSGKHDDEFTPLVKDQLSRVTPADCYVEFGEERGGQAFGVGTASAATTCDYRHKWMNTYSGPIWVARVNFRAYFCWNGSRVWWQEYKNCWVEAQFGFFGDDDYCGVINNNTALATGRVDFWDSTYAAPWYKVYGWMSFTINRWGGTSAVSGFCCN